MRLSKPQNSQSNEGITFFNGFLKHPRIVGSVIPSSRFLTQRIVDIAHVASADSIIELGPGTGGTTRAILNAMQPHCTLLAIEINPDFLPALNQIQDPRLIVHNGNALDLIKIIDDYKLKQPDVIISGIPFTPMPRDSGQVIVNLIWQALKPDGRFVAYQFWHRVESLGQTLFGSAQVDLELLNIPPVRIFSWQKQHNNVSKAG